MQEGGGIWRIFAIVFAVAVGSVFGCLLGFPIFEFLVRPFVSGKGDGLLIVNPSGVFELIFTVAVTTVAGAVLGFLIVRRRLKN